MGRTGSTLILLRRRARSGRVPLLRRIGSARRGRKREDEGLHIRRRQDQPGAGQVQRRRSDGASQGRERHLDHRPAVGSAGRSQQHQRRRHRTSRTSKKQRVVDENAADLKAYGLAEPRIDVTFNVEGDKEPKRILFGEKTPASSGIYAKLPSSNRVFLVASTVETAIDKSTFDFRDKSALAFDQTKVTSLELASTAQTIRLEKSGEEWKLVKPVQAPADFVSVNGLHRPVTVGADDDPEGSSGRSQGSETVRPR